VRGFRARFNSALQHLFLKNMSSSLRKDALSKGSETYHKKQRRTRNITMRWLTLAGISSGLGDFRWLILL
jgi:hypothetical protein